MEIEANGNNKSQKNYHYGQHNSSASSVAIKHEVNRDWKIEKSCLDVLARRDWRWLKARNKGWREQRIIHDSVLCGCGCGVVWLREAFDNWPTYLIHVFGSQQVGEGAFQNKGQSGDCLLQMFCFVL
jgi:hypothetical protein